MPNPVMTESRARAQITTELIIQYVKNIEPLDFLAIPILANKGLKDLVKTVKRNPVNMPATMGGITALPIT